ncbi:MAG: rhomboid family intramembrane serine protease [Bdellovibrionales bacterium]|nr:rhomboid family intramembrane serine protease [Bdellovibrionales bacterium]
MNRGQYSIAQPPFTPMVKKLIIVNAVVWIGIQLILEGFILPEVQMVSFFGLVPYAFLTKFHFWQVFTYMFLHSLDILHIAFNMLLLWFIGSELELKWGSKTFLFYYLFCGIGAGLIYVFGYAMLFIFGYQLEMAFVPVVGASGAIFGLLLAYGVIFGDRTMYFLMIFPMKAKVFVIIIGVVELLMMLKGGSGVANLAHIGGIISGVIFLWFWTLKRQNKPLFKRSKNRPKLQLVIDNDKDDDSKKYWH